MFSLLLEFIFVSSISAQILDLGTDCGLGTVLTENKIYGGSIAKKGDWGWQVALKRNGKFGCGGSLITDQYIITAAHCVDGVLNPAAYEVDIGFNQRSKPDSWSISRKLTKIIRHERHDYDLLDENDIALLKLETPVQLDTVDYKITTVCLPDGTENYVGKTAWATGFGKTTSSFIGSASDELRQVDTHILTDARCRQKFWGKPNPAIQLCAGETNDEKDTCQGDSGGPLVVKGNDGRWHLVGITSYGVGACGSGGVYTRLSAYKDWILRNIANLN